MVSSCSHIRQSQWFNPDLVKPQAQPLHVLKEILGEYCIPPKAHAWLQSIVALQECSQELEKNPAKGKTFHHFPNLPAELRLKIWKESLPRRTIRTTSYGREWNRELPRIWKLEQACREAREVVLRCTKQLRCLVPHLLNPERDILSSWFTSADVLSVGKNTSLLTWTGLDYTTMVGEFDAISIPLSGIDFHENKPARLTAKDLSKVKKLLVVVQEINMELNLPSTNATVAGDGVENPLLTANAPGPMPRTSRHAIHRPRCHLYQVAHLSDRGRIASTLELVSKSFGHGRVEQKTLGNHIPEQCVDCAEVWWKDEGLKIAQCQLLKSVWEDERLDEFRNSGQNIARENWNPGPFPGEQPRPTDLLGIHGDFDAENEWAKKVLNELPPLLPAVGFNFYWNDIVG